MSKEPSTIEELQQEILGGEYCQDNLNGDLEALLNFLTKHLDPLLEDYRSGELGGEPPRQSSLSARVEERFGKLKKRLDDQEAENEKLRLLVAAMLAEHGDQTPALEKAVRILAPMPLVERLVGRVVAEEARAQAHAALDGAVGVLVQRHIEELLAPGGQPSALLRDMADSVLRSTGALNPDNAQTRTLAHQALWGALQSGETAALLRKMVEREIKESAETSLKEPDIARRRHGALDPLARLASSEMVRLLRAFYSLPEEQRSKALSGAVQYTHHDELDWRNFHKEMPEFGAHLFTLQMLMKHIRGAAQTVVQEHLYPALRSPENHALLRDAVATAVRGEVHRVALVAAGSARWEARSLAQHTRRGLAKLADAFSDEATVSRLLAVLPAVQRVVRREERAAAFLAAQAALQGPGSAEAPPSPARG